MSLMNSCLSRNEEEVKGEKTKTYTQTHTIPPCVMAGELVKGECESQCAGKGDVKTQNSNPLIKMRIF